MTESFLHLEAFNMMCGRLLGEGISRKVFVFKPSPTTMVVKVEDDESTYFQNVTEYEIWTAINDRPIAKWFAPCYNISPNGRVMLMGRTEPLPADRRPERLPAFFSDYKQENFGLYEGRVVCHDYGVNNIIRCGLTASLKKVTWAG